MVDEFLIGKKETPGLKQAALARLSEMGLAPFAVRHPASLSGGQKQRLLLALAAESGRNLLVFDEPTSCLLYTSLKNAGSPAWYDGGQCVPGPPQPVLYHKYHG